MFPGNEKNDHIVNIGDGHPQEESAPLPDHTASFLNDFDFEDDISLSRLENDNDNSITPLNNGSTLSKQNTFMGDQLYANTEEKFKKVLVVEIVNGLHYIHDWHVLEVTEYVHGRCPHTSDDINESNELTYRDVRQIFSEGNQQSSIEVRRGCILVRLPPIVSIIMPDSVLLIITEKLLRPDALISSLVSISNSIINQKRKMHTYDLYQHIWNQQHRGTVPFISDCFSQNNTIVDGGDGNTTDRKKNPLGDTFGKKRTSVTESADFLHEQSNRSSTNAALNSPGPTENQPRIRRSSTKGVNIVALKKGETKFPRFSYSAANQTAKDSNKVQANSDQSSNSSAPYKNDPNVYANIYRDEELDNSMDFKRNALPTIPGIEYMPETTRSSKAVIIPNSVRGRTSIKEEKKEGEKEKTGHEKGTTRSFVLRRTSRSPFAKHSKSKVRSFGKRSDPPFEFVVLEILLHAAIDEVRSEIQGPLASAKTICTLLQSNSPSADTLMSMHSIKVPLAQNKFKLIGFSKAINDILNDPNAMLRMELTKLRDYPQLQVLMDEGKTELLPHPSSHLEILLEYFDQESEELREQSRQTLQSLEFTESLLGLKLSVVRNRLVLFDLIMSLVTAGIGIGALVTGIFGMNLLNTLEESHDSFIIVSSSLAIGVVLLTLMGCVVLRKLRQ